APRARPHAPRAGPRSRKPRLDRRRDDRGGEPLRGQRVYRPRGTLAMIGVALALLAVFLALGFPVAAVLAMLGLTLSELFAGAPLWRAMGETSWYASTDAVVVCVPMFILMGEILLRSGIAEALFSAMVRWLSWVPGGIMHANIGAASMFAATSGSSAATAATIGTVAIPEM